MKETTNARFFVYRSAFHGGSRIYEGDNINQAYKAANQDHNNRNCCCGGCRITISINGGEETPTEFFSWKELEKLGLSL